MVKNVSKVTPRALIEASKWVTVKSPRRKLGEKKIMGVSWAHNDFETSQEPNYV